MSAMLRSLSVEHWVLPAMLLWPLMAAIAVRVLGRDTSRDDAGSEAPSGGPDARVLTLIALAVEGLLGV